MDQEYTFEGKFKWAFLGKKNTYGKFSVDFFPKDDATRKAVKATGVKLGIKEDEKDGWGWFYTFRLNPDQKLSPPQVIVTDADGNALTKVIGNGSEGLATIQVYEYDNPEFGKGKGHRLMKVQILNLVEYVRPDAQTQAAPEADGPPVKMLRRGVPFRQED